MLYCCEEVKPMISISYSMMLTLISILWIAVRYLYNRGSRISWKREAQLLLVYICIVVIVRFTFCPFGKVDGKIQPLIFYPDNWYPFRVNWKPFLYLFDYPTRKEVLLNLIGNSTMFLPVGIVWPCVFKKLDKPWKVIAAGIGFSVCIEILQLPFYDRVTDIDDLILNSLGYLAGYGIWLLVKKKK